MLSLEQFRHLQKLSNLNLDSNEQEIFLEKMK